LFSINKLSIISISHKDHFTNPYYITQTFLLISH